MHEPPVTDIHEPAEYPFQMSQLTFLSSGKVKAQLANLWEQDATFQVIILSCSLFDS